MNWLILLQMFSGPLGSLISTGMTAGSSAFIAWSVAKGLPMDNAVSIASAVTLMAGTLINSLTGTQMVKIKDIHDNPVNGVTVVSALDARKAGLTSLDAPPK